MSFKLGVKIPSRTEEMEKYKIIDKPVITAKAPEPNVFFTPIPDNREQILESIKNDMSKQLDKVVLPPRW